jgi:hypothetical protein
MAKSKKNKPASKKVSLESIALSLERIADQLELHEALKPQPPVNNN